MFRRFSAFTTHFLGFVILPAQLPGDPLDLAQDLMTDPEIELRKLIEFLDLPRDGVDDLFANLDEHRQRSVDLYRQNQASYTEGDADKLSHHSDALLSDEEKRRGVSAAYMVGRFHLDHTGLGLYLK